MLVVELLFALLLNQVLVTMVGQTKFSLEDEKVAGQTYPTIFRCFSKSFWNGGDAPAGFLSIEATDINCPVLRCFFSILALFHGPC